MKFVTRKLRTISACLAVLVASGDATARAEANSMLAAAVRSITTEECRDHVLALADDVYEGRGAGTRGGRAAAKYIVQQLAPLGLTPRGDNGGYEQAFGDDCRNILLYREGADPQLKNEVIVIGAHYDHVGFGNKQNSYGTIGKIHNGADDNASGTSALLETIEAVANSGVGGRRSLLFAFWDCEERGLVGSRHWVANPTLPLERVKLAITLDMVGRLREGQLYVLGTRSGYGMRRLFSGAAEPPLWLDFSWELQENSDHWSFLEQRIPIALLHTGLHADYHRPSDDSEKINSDGLREVGRFVLTAALKAANEEKLPPFRRYATQETVAMQRSLEEPLPAANLANWPAELPRPRLGIGWREDAAEPGSVLLTRVVPQTPAADAGLAVKDRIYELDGRTFADADEFQTAILALLDAGQQEVSLLMERRGHLQTVVVRMPDTPRRDPQPLE